LLDYVQRIEVIAGPEGTMLDTNAVKGVINLFTCTAADTRAGAGISG
jgi:outer membrane cobalamin receptor